MPFARQTVGNRLKAFIKFNITPFYPGYDLKAYERALELPVPSKPLYCMQDERWKQQHAEQMELQGSPSTTDEIGPSQSGGINLSAATSAVRL